MTKNLRKYVICEDRLQFNLTVNSNEIWKFDTRIYGDIEIRDSSSLTITCKVVMDPNSRIIVGRGSKLIIDGGWLTSECTEKWNGIIVEGDTPSKQSNSGKVIIRNMAIIEHAKTAVSMLPIHIPWNNGAHQEYYGGIIEAEDCTFRSCNRAVAFMKYDSLGLKDSSYFNNVIFEDLNYGVTIWANDGIIFNNCIFTNIQKSGIYVVDAEVLVQEHNIFERTPIGIDILNLSLRPLSSKIGLVNGIPNEFRTGIGINIQSSSTIEPVRIINNYFEGSNVSDKGIHINGNCFFEISQNNFLNERKGIEIYEAGSNYNIISANEISNSWIGSFAIKTNKGLRFLDNCFSLSSYIDIVVTNGGVFPFQGELGLAAGNCFSKNQIAEFYNSNDPLTYYLKSNTQQSSCFYPTNHYNISLNVNATDQNSSLCASDMNELIDPIVACTLDAGNTISQLIAFRASIIQGIANSTANSYNRKNYEQCLEVCESLIVRKMLDYFSNDVDAGIENAINFLVGVGMDFRDSVAAYGIILGTGDINRAESFLNSIFPRDTEQADFIDVQKIYLDFLSDPLVYQLSSTDSSFLYSSGNTDGPYYGYARSIYEILTGERIEVDIPIQWRGRDDINLVQQKSQILKIYPNPSLDGLISIFIDNIPSQKYSVKLINHLGVIVSEMDIYENGIYSIGEPYLGTGIYHLSMWDNIGNLIQHSKVLILK